VKKELSVAILALLMVSLVAIGCARVRIEPVDPPPQGPYPAPPIEWSRTFGGPHDEEAWSVQQTACGGFVIAGWTESFGAGNSDFWLVKTDPEGNKKWSQTFGGPEWERARSVQQTACGGFIIAGSTGSFDEGAPDFWPFDFRLVKTDPEGNKEWSRTFGGPYSEVASSVQQTACGGFIIAGYTASFGAGGRDFWLVKTDPEGNKKWSRTFGGPHWDSAFSVQQTACGGFIIAGLTRSFGAGRGDFWLVKTDPEGNKKWSRTFGGPHWDSAFSVQQTACGGFIIAGETQSFGVGDSDFWLVKTDPEGNKKWSQTFGGPAGDGALSVQQTADGGFVIAGYVARVRAARVGPLGMGVAPIPRHGCVWVVKTDAYGNLRWTQAVGTLEKCDIAHSVKQTACGGFIVAGVTRSFGAGRGDMWLIKIAPETGQ